ncbi:MAG: sigma-70 family RNA polymerase sigma factor [Anaerolineae bacterium]|nr:sigma-70 family RNA polymerase sigma factor [Anaerolineae bacterium]
MTDQADLLEQAADGVHPQAYDKAALSKLYDRYAPKMYAYIYRRVGDAQVAEDLTGELFVRMLRAIQNGQSWQRSLRAWLYRIAHNLVVDHYRRRPTSGDVSLDFDGTVYGSDGTPYREEILQTEAGNGSSLDDPVQRVDDLDDRERLASALHQLTPEQQQVLALRFGEGLRTRRVAEVMDKTVGAVEALQRRALAALKRLLGGETV